MAPSVRPVKHFLQRVLPALVLVALASMATPSLAGPLAPLLPQSDNGDGEQASPGRRSIDPFQCGVWPGRRGSQPADRNCPNVYGGDAPHRRLRPPGPSAFGLQFDTGDY